MNMAVRSSAFGCACEAPRRRRDVGVDYRDGTSHDDSRVRSPHVYSLRSLPLPMCNVTSLGAVTRELSSPSRDGLTDRAQRRRHYRVRDRMAAGRSGLEALCGWLPGTVRPQAVSRSAHSGQGQRCPVGLDGVPLGSVVEILKTCDVQSAAGGAHHAI